MPYWEEGTVNRIVKIDEIITVLIYAKYCSQGKKELSVSNLCSA